MEYQVLALLKIFKDKNIKHKILNSMADFETNQYYFDLRNDYDLTISLVFKKDFVIANVNNQTLVYSFDDLRDLEAENELNDLLIMSLWYFATVPKFLEINTFYAGNNTYRLTNVKESFDIILDFKLCEHNHLVTHDYIIDTYTIPTTLDVPIYLQTLFSDMQDKKHILTSEKEETISEVRSNFLNRKYPLELANTFLSLKYLDPDLLVSIPKVKEPKIADLQDFDGINNYAYSIDIVTPKGNSAIVVINQSKFAKIEEFDEYINDYTHIHIKISKTDSEKHIHYFARRNQFDTVVFRDFEGKTLNKKEILENIINQIEAP